MEAGFPVEVLNCHDLENVGLWKSGMCCKNCHNLMDYSTDEFPFLTATNGQEMLPGTQLHGVIVCCKAFALLNEKLEPQAIRDTLDTHIFQKIRVFNLFKSIFDDDDSETIRGLREA